VEPLADQVERRVIEGEKIPREEKIFSLFEPHTEWISKGKAGVPVELGVNVCILEDQHRFILQHKVMEKTIDKKVAVPIVEAAQVKFSDLKICSFDKGFYTPLNREWLREMLDVAVMPKKGKLSKEEREIEKDEEFVHLRHKHAAVESAIAGLHHHGLDRCPDHGIGGFKRYVALAVLGANIRRLGVILREKERKKQPVFKKAA